MTVERRLHHAARELREVSIEVPELSELSHPARPAVRRPRLAALAAPMLFVAGSLLAVGVMQQQIPEPPHSDIPAASVPGGTGSSSSDLAAVVTPSVRDELLLIAELVDGAPRPSSTTAEHDDVPGTGTGTGTGPS